MVNWIYSHSVWQWGTVFVLLVTAATCRGLVAVDRLVHPDLRRKHNDIAAAKMAIVGVAYAVLLAFIAVATWEQFTSADKIVDTEASYAGNLYRGTIGLPADKAEPMKADVKKYLHQVTEEEWPQQQMGAVSQVGRRTLVHLHSLIGGINPTNLGEAAITGELLHQINGLYDARRARILAADTTIPAIIWWIIGFGTVITLSFMCFFGAPSFSMQLSMAAMVAASMALVIVLIVGLDRPFRGDLSISKDAYENVLNSIADAEGG